jgi:pyruvate/2-oxoglutarate dehydrogenase complex dihydrolipoamide dehydrogenase (E3) component
MVTQNQEVGVKVSPRGIVEVDDHFKTNVPSIRAIGDCIRGPMLGIFNLKQFFNLKKIFNLNRKKNRTQKSKNQNIKIFFFLKLNIIFFST